MAGGTGDAQGLTSAAPAIPRGRRANGSDFQHHGNRLERKWELLRRPRPGHRRASTPVACAYSRRTCAMRAARPDSRSASCTSPRSRLSSRHSARMRSTVRDDIGGSLNLGPRTADGTRLRGCRQRVRLGCAGGDTVADGSGVRPTRDGAVAQCGSRTSSGALAVSTVPASRTHEGWPAAFSLNTRRCPYGGCRPGSRRRTC